MATQSEDPYREERDYHAIALISASGFTARDILPLISATRVGDIEDVGVPDEGLVALRAGFFRAKPYRTTPQDFLDAIGTTWRGKPAYRYDLYCAAFQGPGRGTITAILAVPLAEMAEEVFGRIRTSVAGKGVRFGRSDLARLVTYALEAEAEAADVRVSGIRLRIDGDPPAEDVLMRGRWRENLLRTRTYDNVASGLGGTAVPIQARVVHKPVGRPAFCLRVSDQGYLRFNIGRRALGLASAKSLVSILQSAGIMRPSTAFPAVEPKQEE
jgi:hypothetical protein